MKGAQPMRKSVIVINAFIIQLALLGIFSYVPPLSIPLGVSIAPTEQEVKGQMKADANEAAMTRAVLSAANLYSSHKCHSDFSRLTAENAILNHIRVRLVAAVVVMESGCKPHIISSAGAAGLMQIMPRSHHISTRALLDPAVNIRIGTLYLASLIHKYGEREGLHHYLGMGTTDGNMTGDDYASNVLSIAAGSKHKRRIDG
jgi:Transglycosylase SLT domain